MDVASLIVKVTTTGVQTTQQQLDKLANTASATQKVAGGLNLGMLGLSATLGLITKEAIKMGDEWTNINSKLNLVTKTTQDFNKAQTELFNISQNTRTSLSSTVELYRKLAVSTESLNISQNRLLKVTETINKAGMVGGGSKESINAALIQLGQGLASGALRGEELNSVLEQTPRLAKLIADGMGVQVGALKSLAEAGKITSETIIKAAEDGAKGIAKEFDVIQVTFSSSMDVAEGSITKLVGTLDEATGATRTLSQTIIEMSKYLNENNTDIVATGQFIYATISRTIDVFNVLYETVENTAQIVVGHINLLVYGSLEGILTMLTKATEGLNVLGIASDKGLKEAYADLAYVQGLVANANNLIADSYNDLNKAVVKLSPTIEDRIKQYNAENKAISDKLALQKKELETTTGKSKKEVEAELKAEKEKEEARKKAQKDAIKLAEEWQKRKIEIATNIAIAEQDKLAEPFIKLEAKYKQDLEHFKGNKEAQIMLTNEYNAEVTRLQKDLTKNFNEEEDKKAKKSAEWQVKIFEANEKYNDEIIKMQDEMYGTDTSVDAWYNNQLEYLGKLSQEAGATAEELQTLLDKIETLKAMKLEKQTISFKVEQSFYQSFENNLADSIEEAFNGDLNFKKFFRNIGNDLLRTVSSSFAGIGTNALRGNYSSALSALGIGASLIGSNVSASEIGSLMNSGATFDSATNSIKTSGGSIIKLGADGSGTLSSGGSDILSLASNISSLNTAYNLISNGLSSTVMSGFSGLANLTGISGISQFGYGFTNPFASSQLAGLYGSGVPELSGLSSIGSTAGGMALGGLGGYALGSIGDKLFGADTKAGSFGAIGGALGSLGGPIGIAVGSVLGSVLGGFFGSTKQTGSGINFGSLTGNGEGFDDIQSYIDYKKKSWFSSKSWTDYTALTSSQKKQIEGIFETYDFLLVQLGETENIFLQAGKYTGETFGDQLSKNFISIFTDVSQDTNDEIYQAWVSYAEGIDKTVMEALTASVSSFTQSKRTFELWTLGDSIEALAKRAEFATADLDLMKNSMGTTGVTVESFLTDFNNAVKTNFTPETITQWESLGNALMTATDAQKAYTDAVKAQEDALANFIQASNEYLVNFNIWSKNSSGATIDGLKIKADYLQSSFESLEKSMGLSGITVDNFVSTYKSLMNDDLGVINQDMVTQLKSLGNALMGATDAQKAYETALNQQTVATKQANEAIRQSTLNILWQQLTDLSSSLDSIQNALDDLNPTFMTFAELAKQTINLDNYSTLLSQLESSRQNEIEKLTQSSNLRIEQLEKEKTLFTSIYDFVGELTQRIIGFSVTTSSYFFRELANAKALITTGGTTDISSLKNSATFYLDKVLGQSTSRLEYLREVAKVSEGIGGLGTLATGGSLEGIENAINEEQEALENQLTQLNETATNILNSWKSQAGLNISATASNIKGVQNDVISSAYKEILGRTPDTAGYQYWSNDITSGALNSSNITKAISIAAIDEIYNNVLGRNADEAGKDYWIGQINSGAIAPSDIDEAIKNAAIVNGSHAGGLERVPFDGYIAELHKGERVQTASEVQKDSIINELQNSLKDLKDMFIKNIAETSRMSRVITRLDDNDALLVRVVV